jgi:stage V sporulation protein AD
MMIYNRSEQDTHSGGSGCGCSAVVMASYIIPKIERGELRNVLFLGTGAMMSPSSIQQGEAIPGVAHLVRLCRAEDIEE